MSKKAPSQKTCLNCGKQFISFRPSKKFAACSFECRLFIGIKTGQVNECWEWFGLKNKDGYGEFWFEYKRWIAHRAAYTIAKGTIPVGMVVMHSCDNPPCCNPSHLSIGTAIDNNADRQAKGRGSAAFGIKSGNVVLNDEKVREIRKSSQKAEILENNFGVKVQCIYKIKQGIRWKHVT